MSISRILSLNPTVDPRRLARGFALQALYEIDTNDQTGTEVMTFRDVSALVNPDVRMVGYLTLLEHHEKGDDAPDDDHIAISDIPEDRLLTPEGQQMAVQLVRGVLEQKGKLDAIIQRYAPEYPVDQMAVIDRNVLRIAIYEMAVGKDTPVRVAINEAVELAKMFGSDTAPSFVNGLLGTLADQRKQIIAELAPHDDSAG
jgi:transcription antitermination factor NusB